MNWSTVILRIIGQRQPMLIKNILGINAAI